MLFESGQAATDGMSGRVPCRDMHLQQQILRRPYPQQLVVQRFLGSTLEVPVMLPFRPLNPVEATRPTAKLCDFETAKARAVGPGFGVEKKLD